MAKTFGLSQSGPRGAVILYSFFTFKQVDFNSYNSLEAFNTKVDSSPRLGRNGRPRRIDLALKEAGKLLKQSQRVGPKVVILLAGGRQNQETGSLEEAKQSLRSAGAKIYVIAFGKNVDPRALGVVTQQSQDIFTVLSHQELVRYTRPVAHRVKITQGERENGVVLEKA